MTASNASIVVGTIQISAGKEMAEAVLPRISSPLWGDSLIYAMIVFAFCLVLTGTSAIPITKH